MAFPLQPPVVRIAGSKRAGRFAAGLGRSSRHLDTGKVDRDLEFVSAAQIIFGGNASPMTLVPVSSCVAVRIPAIAKAFADKFRICQDH